MNAIQNKYDYNGRELVIYLERQYIDKYRCIDRERRLLAVRSFVPAGTSLLYCYMDRYNIKTIDTDFIIDRIPVEYENSYMLIRYNPDREQYFYCIGGRWAGADNGYMSKATGKYVINKLRELGTDNNITANMVVILARGCRNVKQK